MNEIVNKQSWGEQNISIVLWHTVYLVDTNKKVELYIFWEISFTRFRSNHRRYSVRKGVLRNLTKFTGKLLCQRLFFNKVAGVNFSVSWKKNRNYGLKWMKKSFWNNKKQSFFGMKLQRNHGYNGYASSICINAGRKLALLARRVSKWILLKLWILPDENKDTLHFSGSFIQEGK